MTLSIDSRFHLIIEDPMQLRNFTKVDFPHNALHFMMRQQFVNTDESLGLLALFSARKLTKWYDFCDLFKSSYGTLFLESKLWEKSQLRSFS